MRSENRSIIKYLPAVLISALAVIAGILLPGFLLEERGNAGLDRAEAAPAKYYNAAGFALSRNISAQMDTYDRLRLVSGSWESSFEEAEEYEMSFLMHEAAAAARKGIDGLYDKGLYPTRLSSEYGNWFSWTAIPCKAVDSVFNTYTAYYWKVIFKSFDSEERHTVYVLEDGTLIAAEAYIPDADFADRIADAYTVKSLSNAVYTRQPANGLNPQDWTALPDLDVSGMKWKDLVLITAYGGKSWYVMQLFSDERYIFLIKV